MEVRIISREIIKPSSSTPNHLKTHKLSLLDQSNLNGYFSFILFYSTRFTSSSDHLKKSLSETLTHYYPFAGRVKDCFSVECGDYGVTFIEAQVTGKIFEVLQQQEIDLLKMLVQRNHEESSTTQGNNVAVQINYFDCGRVAIAVGFRHAVADATTAANFIKSWATISRGGNDIKNVIFDCTSIFPPIDFSVSTISTAASSSTETIIKRFVFEGSNIAELQDTIGKGRSTTRFEAVSALIWSAIIAAKTATNESTTGEEFHAIIPVSLRKKMMNLPALEQCIGNIITLAIATWTPLTEEKIAIDYKRLAGKVRESISRVNEQACEQACADDDDDIIGSKLLKMRDRVFASDAAKSNEKRLVFLSSVCGLPFYEADFGRGEPIWMTCVRDQSRAVINEAILLDTKDGKGIEACVRLPAVDMTKFEQHPAILAYASFNNPLILEF
ncbi:hypothetical protein ACOSP7_013794 [Xanthoceras sorbifolium]